VEFSEKSGMNHCDYYGQHSESYQAMQPLWKLGPGKEGIVQLGKTSQNPHHHEERIDDHCQQGNVALRINAKGLFSNKINKKIENTQNENHQIRKSDAGRHPPADG
jgi:hypothetical protein